MNFPGPLIISSSLVIRNTGAQPVEFGGELIFSGGDSGTVVKAPIQEGRLAAGEVRRVDLGQIKAHAGVPASLVSASVVLQYTGNAGVVMARVFGASQDRAYGFYWTLQSSAGRSYAESFWRTDNQWMPILTVGNFSNTADTITLELTSNFGTFSVPPFSLQPYESRTLNIRDLLNQAQPFPSSVNFGGYRVSGASNQSRLIVKEHLLDPVSKLATPFYGAYIYATEFYANPSSYTAYVGGDTVGFFTQILYSDGTYEDGCPDSYSSYGPSIATVVKNGCVGVITPVGAGTANIGGSQSLIVDPQGDYGDPEAQGTVTVNCAYPTNFRQTSGSGSNGVLSFEYAWSSSDGTLGHLSACRVYENVTYPQNTDPYYPSSPPFPSLPYDNPTVKPTSGAPGTDGGFSDTHSTPGTFVTPFPIGTTSFTAVQYYYFTCPCRNGGLPVKLYPTDGSLIQITRSVNATSSTSGTFTITKSGVSSSKAVP